MKFAILLVVCAIAKVYGDEPEAIVGGMNASPGQFPYQISLQNRGSHTCGGTIISPTHIVTAAHCIPSQSQWGYLSVVTGLHNLRIMGKAQRHSIKCIQVHPQYGSNPRVIDYDVALITLSAPIQFSSLQSPLPLASRDYSVGGSQAALSGWGQLGARAGIPDTLQWIPLNVISMSACQGQHPGSISNRQVCTYVGHGKGACMGDSGGPLVSNGELCGIVSWGAPCAVGKPDVFTNVFIFRSFIQQCQQRCP